MLKKNGFKKSNAQKGTADPIITPMALATAVTGTTLFGVGGKMAYDKLKPKAPALPPPVPMPDPEDRIKRLEEQRRTTAAMATSGRQSTVMSGSPATRTTSKLG